MDKDFIFIISHLKRLVNLHNLLADLDTITFKECYFKQLNIRKYISYIIEELDIDINKYIKIKYRYANSSDIKYLKVEE